MTNNIKTADSIIENQLSDAEGTISKIFGMPRFLILLFFVEMWERFSYYGMRALLVLFITSYYGFSDPKAYALYSLFAALGYATSLPAGFLADKVLGFRNMIIWGGVTIAFGHGLLFFVQKNETFLYGGLTMIAIGTGLFKGNNANIIGICYPRNDPSGRDKAFTLFYVAVNIGAFASSVLCGLIAKEFGWDYGFATAGVAILMGLAAFLRFNYLLGDKGLAPNPALLKKRIALGLRPLPLIILSLIATAVMLYNILSHSEESIENILVVTSVIFVGVLSFLWRQSAKEERINIVIVLLLLVFQAIFFVFEMQIGALFTLFTERNIDTTILGYTVPASVLSGINPFVIIIGGSLFAKVIALLSNRLMMVRFGLGMAALVASIAVLYFGCFTADANGKISVAFLFISMILMALGEVFIAPLIYAVCTLLSPKRYKGVIMSFLILSLSYANFAGAKVGKLMAADDAVVDGEVDALKSLAIYQEGFWDITVFTVIVLGIFICMAPFLNKGINKAVGRAKEA
jgi:POT family proton-dependent oligopeptide transporter